MKGKTMAKRLLSVLMATAEVEPFSKVGGLGDVIGALPKALYGNKVDIRLITPLYGFIDRKAFGIRKVAGLDEIPIRVGEEIFTVRFFRTNFPDTKVQVFFVECDELFDRPGVYTDSDTGEGYRDNPTRFILFSKAVIEFLKTGVFTPKIIHLNDNQSALVAPLLRTQNIDPKLREIKLLLAIHNLEYQGQYSMRYLYDAGLDDKLAYPGGPFEFYGGFNFLKAGIIYSDIITTVSETYAKETIESPDYGYGLEGVLGSRKRDYFGITNGADYSVWNPAEDKFIPKRYTSRSLNGKTVNKEALLERCGFSSPDPNRPIAGMISRLTDQKGINLLLSCLPELMKLDIYFVILGKGNFYYQDELRRFQENHPDKMAVFIDFDKALAHLIEAGSDIYLMPSRFEPCGLNQIYSLKYGAIPVVRQTGGLADTVRNYSPDTGEGWGFTFKNYSPYDFIEAFNRVLEVYKDQTLWKKICRRAMALDYSWDKAARKYRELYAKLLNVER